VIDHVKPWPKPFASPIDIRVAVVHHSGLGDVLQPKLSLMLEQEGCDTTADRGTYL
jgi:hypothetical protein